jgi:beta-1,4-mannosyltransferase
MAGLIFILANDFTIIFLGDKWAPIIPAVQTLAIGGLLRSIGSASGPLFQGVGKPRIIAILQAVRLIFIIAAIYPAILYLGILGAALTITLTALLTFPIQTFVVIRTIKSSVKEYSKLLIIPFTGTIVFILAIILYRYFNPEVMNLFIFIIAIIFSLLMYGVIIFISEKFFGYHIKEELLSSFLKRLIKRDGRKKKIKVLMVPHYSNPYQGLLKDSLIKKSVEVYFGSSEHIFSNIRSVLSSWKPQIIHVHWLTRFLNSNGLFEQIVKSSLFIIEIMLIKLIGIKIVWTVHNITSHEPKSINIEIFYRKIFAKLCNRIIVHCTFAKEEIVRLFNTKKNKIETIPMGNFVGKYKNKLSRYEARKILDVGKDELVFLNIGKIRDYKGIFDLTYAFQKNRNSGIKIFIIGKVSDKEIRKRLNVSADQNKNIILKLEYIPDEDIQIYLNASDLLILPYKNILTSSTAILGMSFQKAVIAPSIGCIPELLAKQQRDLLYDLDEKNGLEKAISRALYLKDKLPEIGQQNYKEIEKYTWNYAASKTKNLYEDII